MNLWENIKNLFTRPVSESIDSEDSGYTKLGDDDGKNLDINYLKEIREEAWKAFLTNPLAKRQVRNITSYLVGRGLKVTSPSEDAQEIIDNFIDDPDNYWELFIREESNRLQIDGEMVVLLYVNTGDGTVKIRDIEPNEIVEVILSPEDYRKILALKRVYTKKVYSDDFKTYHTVQIEDYIQPGEPDPNNSNIIRDFLFVKMPTVATQFRGVPELASHLYWLKQYRQLLDARINLNKMRASYIWDVSVDGTDTDVSNVRKANSKPPRPGTVKFHNAKVTWEPKSLNINAQDSESDIRAVKLMTVAGAGQPEYMVSGKANSKPPRPGTVKFHNAKVTWEPKSLNINAQDSESDIRAVKLMTVAGAGQPEYMVSGDASNANFASTQETTFSFLKCLEDYQDLFEYFIGSLLSKVCAYAQKYGAAPAQFLNADGEEIKGNNLVNITFPETKPKDIEKLGRYLQTLQLMQIASNETLAGMAGIDWETEKPKLESEAEDGYPEPEPPEDVTQPTN